MAKKNKEEKHLNARQRAYEQKQAQEGEKVIKWIFGILIALAVLYMCYVCYLMQ